MARLPLLSSRQIVRTLERGGFRATHTAGSHQTMERSTGRRTIITVVVLGKREVPRGTLRYIIRLAEMTIQQFNDLL